MGYCVLLVCMDYNNSDFCINIEDYEKLKAKVANNEIYITELLEEKIQAEEQKQIITG